MLASNKVREKHDDTTLRKLKNDIIVPIFSAFHSKTGIKAAHGGFTFANTNSCVSISWVTRFQQDKQAQSQTRNEVPTSLLMYS